jgi:K+-transporting ATPase ATPase C chain
VLAASVKERLAAVAKEDGVTVAQVPVDLVTASASGLDPDVSVQAALIQVRRVARARGLQAKAVEQLVRSHVEGRTLGFIGSKRVNVLSLNIALTKLRTQ